jgi:nucleotide-binding universal stress UspA family protein
MTTKPSTRIVCASDLSDASRDAIDTAIELASLYRPARVDVLHVHEVPERLENLQQTIDRWEVRRSELSAEVDAEIAKLRAARPGLDVDIQSEVLAGKPYREILNYALRVDADILVVGTHGRTGFRHALLGSVAEKVVRKAPCTVVVAKPADVRAYLAEHLAGQLHPSRDNVSR